MNTDAGEYGIIEPKRIVVFGVMHIVFGVLGLLQTVGGLVMLPFMDKILRLGAVDELEEYYQAVEEITAKMQVVSYCGLAFSGILGIVLLFAGIGLVKRKARAVKLSNIYAWLSIGMKCVAVILFFVVTKPALDSVLDPLMTDADAMIKTQLTIQRVSHTVGGVLTPPLMMLYPIIALVMLNRPMVKDYLASRGR
ncbi:MAG: hypothetical protein HKN82_16010 [Akkermansiaceae bacterium]|nr:hypothetical protein [Akkermansiaceae bacterium]